jgi:hypothetical protein
MKNITITGLTIILLSLVASVFAQAELPAAQTYELGHGALEIFNGDAMAHTPQWVQIWILFMIASFAVGLFFVGRHPIARWVVGGFLAGMVLSTVLTSGLGLASLSGLIACVHVICWSPALYQLLSKRPFLGERSAFSIWSGVITFVITFSFIFDVRDAAIYLNHML